LVAQFADKQLAGLVCGVDVIRECAENFGNVGVVHDVGDDVKPIRWLDGNRFLCNAENVVPSGLRIPG
jgi:hypothetical protein